LRTISGAGNTERRVKIKPACGNGSLREPSGARCRRFLRPRTRRPKRCKWHERIGVDACRRIRLDGAEHTWAPLHSATIDGRSFIIMPEGLQHLAQGKAPFSHVERQGAPDR
jgi:hypothetical protein